MTERVVYPPDEYHVEVSTLFGPVDIRIEKTEWDRPAPVKVEAIVSKSGEDVVREYFDRTMISYGRMINLSERCSPQAVFEVLDRAKDDPESMILDYYIWWGYIPKTILRDIGEGGGDIPPEDIVSESAPGGYDFRTDLAKADDIDDIAGVFVAPPSNNSPYFKNTSTSIVMPLADLVPREAPDPQRLKNAHGRMAAAKQGTFERRKPIGVVDLGNGMFKVVDGNTTFHALLELGETKAVVEVLKDGRTLG